MVLRDATTELRRQRTQERVTYGMTETRCNVLELVDS